MEVIRLQLKEIFQMGRKSKLYNRGWTNELMSDEDTKAVFDVSADWSNPSTNSVYWLAGRPINPSCHK